MGVLRNSTEGFAYSDHGRNINLNGRDKFREWTCEIVRFDKEGRMVSGGCYYDQYTLLTQLGRIQPLPAAA